MTAEFAPKELLEANEKCDKIIEMIASIPRDNETHDALEQAFRLVLYVKQNIETRLLLERSQHGTSHPNTQPGEKIWL